MIGSGWMPERTKQPGRPPEDVHFCRAITRESAAARWSELLIGAATIGALALLLMPMIYAAQRLGRWSVAVEIGTMAVAAACCWAMVLKRQRFLTRARERCAANPPLEDLPHARVICAAGPADLATHGPFENLPFEPAIFWATCAPPLRGRSILLACVAAGVVGFAVSLFLRRAIGLRDMLIYPIWIAPAVAAALYLWRWPAYFRVTPGRLELLQFSAFRRQPVRWVRHDLKGGRVVVDVPRRVLFIGLAGAGATPFGSDSAEYSFALVPDGLRFAHRVLLAAISTHDTPTPPADELLG